MTDWIEKKTDELLAQAKRSRFFGEIISDARRIESDEAVVWDVALARSVDYWCDGFLTR